MKERGRGGMRETVGSSYSVASGQAFLCLKREKRRKKLDSTLGSNVVETFTERIRVPSTW
jgi:hypothetical protein